MCRECRERFPPPSQVGDPDMHHGTCVTHVPWCMPGSLISGFLWSRWRGKRSRHSRRMRNPHFHVSGKKPMALGNLGLYSLSGQTLYPKISWRLTATRFRFRHFQCPWNLSGTSEAALARWLSNLKEVRWLQHRISRLRIFTRFEGKTSYRLMNKVPGLIVCMIYWCDIISSRAIYW